ncbi:MAG: hypothetical protein EG828_11185 [Deltaproteobacteria bacterium]|nr:hypothetical protein [Deltaproteobacteria bacterium]
MKLCIIFTIAAIMAGCATTYQAHGWKGGFSSVQLDENVFQVTFNGNGYTSRERANDFALLRSAELTLEYGYKYFVIVDARQHSENSSYTTPATATTNLSGQTYGSTSVYGNNANFYSNTNGTATTTISGGETVYISKPSSSNTIICFKEKPEVFSYNAEFVARGLKEKYGLLSP